MRTLDDDPCLPCDDPVLTLCRPCADPMLTLCRPCSVAAMFRKGAVRILEGEEDIEWLPTRGSFLYLNAMERAYCKHCKTPGVVERFKETMDWLFWGTEGNLRRPSTWWHCFGDCVRFAGAALPGG